MYKIFTMNTYNIVDGDVLNNFTVILCLNYGRLMGGNLRPFSLRLQRLQSV